LVLDIYEMHGENNIKYIVQGLLPPVYNKYGYELATGKAYPFHR
jgi:hypothetical protein